MTPREGQIPLKISFALLHLIEWNMSEAPRLQARAYSQNCCTTTSLSDIDSLPRSTWHGNCPSVTGLSQWRYRSYWQLYTNILRWRKKGKGIRQRKQEVHVLDGKSCDGRKDRDPAGHRRSKRNWRSHLSESSNGLISEQSFWQQDKAVFIVELDWLWGHAILVGVRQKSRNNFCKWGCI